jgi:hypothetical protein
MSYGFQDTVTALETLQEKLQAIQYESAPLFQAEAVRIFDMTDLAAALLELLNFSNRICLIVHDREKFRNEKKGNELHTWQTRDLVLLIADRHFANRQTALIGDGDKTPGALKMKDMVLGEVVGLLQPGMFIQPIDGEQLVLQQKERAQLQGRVAFSLGLQLVGGNIITELGRQPIV